MEETPPPACPTCTTPYNARYNTQHCTSPTCNWIRCGRLNCGTTYQATNPTHHYTDD